MNTWKDELPLTTSSFHRRVETTLAGLEEREMKHIFRRMPVLVFAILILTIAATALAATAMLRGTVDWEGNFTPLETNISIQTTPPPEKTEYDSDVTDILANVPDGEYWEVWIDSSGTGSMGFIGQDITTADELSAAIEGLPLRTAEMPEGYKPEIIELLYDTRGLEYEKYMDELIGSAHVVKYKVSEPLAKDIKGYWMYYVNENGSRLTIDVSLFRTEDSDEALIGDFYVGEGETYEKLNVEGADRALMISEEDGTTEIKLQTDIEEGLVADYCIRSSAGLDPDEMLAILGF